MICDWRQPNKFTVFGWGVAPQPLTRFQNQNNSEEESFSDLNRRVVAFKIGDEIMSFNEMK